MTSWDATASGASTSGWAFIGTDGGAGASASGGRATAAYPAVLYREVEGPLRAWLRAQPGIAALTGGGQHVYFAAPDLPAGDARRPDAWLTVRRIGGGPMPGNTPLDVPLVTFECWGRTKLAASRLAETLVNLLTGLEGPTAMDTVVALSCRVTLWLFQPDPTLGSFARVLVDASFVFRAAAAA